METNDPSNNRTDAVVLLAGSYGERAPTVARLWSGGYGERVVLTNDGVLSRWSPAHNRNLYQVEWAEEELVRLGVPREKIVKLPFYESGTVYDALAVRRYALSHGIHSMTLVTSDYHMRRAFWTFRRVFAGAPVEMTVSPAPSPATGWKCKAIEKVKMVYYFVKFGVLRMIPSI